MAFHDAELPDGFQYGSQAGFAFATVVQETASGHEFRVARQAQGRHRFRLLKALLEDEDVATLKAFALARRGMLHSFKVQDFADNTTASDGQTAPSDTDQILGTADGTTTTFQLVKRYDAGGLNEYTRVLTLPDEDSIVVALGGTPTTAFTTTSDGRIVLNSAPANGVVVTAGCSFYVPVRFERDLTTVQADAFGVWSVTDFDCVEVLNEVEWPERFFHGGVKNWGATGANVAMAYNDGELHYIDPTASIHMTLPAPSRVPGGPRIFRVAIDASAIGSVQLLDDTGNNVGGSLNAGDIVDVSLVVDGNDATWLLR